MLKVLLVVVLLDVMAVGLGAATATTRGIFALGRDRKIPGAVAKTTGGGNPIGSALVVAVVSVAWVVATQVFDGVFNYGVLEPSPGEFADFTWISTMGAFLIMAVYGVMSFGAFFGLSDHPNKVALVISGILGIGVAVGAIFGAIYEVPEPLNSVWVVGAIWAAIGLVIALIFKGREPARRALADLSTGEEG
jgi:amino acid permease